MGVYIDGMEMPKTCRECAYFWAGLKSCDAKYGLPVVERWDIERARFCPLTEVPEPHGRLVDIDKALEVIALEYGYDGIEDDMEYKVPTVIERSK